MNKLEKVNSELRTEANTILDEKGFISLLEKYGTPLPTGSYSLNTMTWRDLDVYLINDEMDSDKFFQLGREMVNLFNPRRMSFRDEFIGETPGLPSGYYWGIYSQLGFSKEWKIDVWAIDSKQAENFEKLMEEINEGLMDEKRLYVLKIKSHFCHHPEYRGKITSMDIYRSVIDDKVKSIESFKEWLKAKNVYA